MSTIDTANSSVAPASTAASSIGVVVIGRNEGERLRRSLSSIVSHAKHVVYVDSGSVDESLATAKSLGVDVVELDLSQPFSAARARNVGFDHLKQLAADLQFVQFVDGDCEIDDRWIETALQSLQQHPTVAVVCGRRREKFPEQSIYNAMCDMEWDVPPGETTWCGGDAFMRAGPFAAVNGFDASLIAGEEPELCRRLIAAGWKILRLSAEMTRHDAAVTRFSQWWRRSIRSGHAFAEGAALKRTSDDGYCLRESRSIWLWGVIVPALALIAAWPTRGISLLLLLYFPLKALLVAVRKRRVGNPWSRSLFYGYFCLLGKFPQAWGQIQFLRSRSSGKSRTVIEYKGVA